MTRQTLLGLSILCVVLTLLLGSASASWADESKPFRRCVAICEEHVEACQLRLSERSTATKLTDSVFGWNCTDDCTQYCIWNITDIVLKIHDLVPKFYGKWPLIRYFGFLEPASSVFSFLSLLSSCLGFLYLKTYGSPNSKYARCYNVMFASTVFTWISSTLFHMRDVKLLERMDYYGAFVSIFLPLFWFICRHLYPQQPLAFRVTTFAIMACLLFDMAYMEFVKFNHTLHLTICTVIAGAELTLWFVWLTRNWSRQPHIKKYLVCFGTFAVGPLIAKYREWEPPLFWIFDAHSLFHLFAIPVPFLFWWAVTADDVFLNSSFQKAI